jgi:hypothetical protein
MVFMRHPTHGWIFVALTLTSGCASNDGQGTPGGNEPAGNVGAAGDGAGSGGAPGSAGSPITGTGTGTAGSTQGGGGTGGGSAGTANSGGSGGMGGGVGVGACKGPALTAGTWVEITPPSLDLKSSSNHSYGANDVQLDPNDACVLYACFDMRGMYKTTDAGASWSKIGNLDSPLHMRIDPKDSKHLYAIQGVRGATMGFWVSTDAGMTWTKPAAFHAGEGTTWTDDGYWIAVDPTDFKHVLITFHSPWHDPSGSGVLESTDGAATFIPHKPNGGWGGAGLAISFLYSPSQGLGDAKTWLLGTQSNGGFYRTTDSGGTWTNVTKQPMMHGGTGTFYASNKVLYSGANNQIMRSTDNGVTWTLVGPKFQDGYYTVIGDGTNLYAQEANTGGNSVGPQTYVTSKETDGVTWTSYSSQTFTDGPFAMAFDQAGGIIYSANWQAGIWALKVK